MWILATLLYGRENKNLRNLGKEKDALQNWRGKTLEVLVHAAMSYLEFTRENPFRERDRNIRAHLVEEVQVLQVW